MQGQVAWLRAENADDWMAMLGSHVDRGQIVVARRAALVDRELLNRITGLNDIAVAAKRFRAEGFDGHDVATG
jgi:hypothetical protein